MALNEQAVKIAVKIIKNFEGCNLTSYPDPASPLYAALSRHGMLQKYMSGDIKWDDLEDNFKALSGTPWTVGHGSTQGVTKSTVWTQAQADAALEAHVREFMEGALKASPRLVKVSPEKIAAVTSFCYNVGLNNYKTSTVAKMIAVDDMVAAANAFLLWNKAQGKILTGLVKRREVERNLFLAS